MADGNNTGEFTPTGDKDEDYVQAAMNSQSHDWSDIDGEDNEEENEDENAIPPANPPATADPASTDPPAVIPEPAKPEVPITPVIDEDAFLGKLSQGRVKSKVEFDSILNRKDLAKYPDLEKLHEHFENGGNIDSFNTIRAIGEISELSSLEVVKKDLQIANPSLKSEQIDSVLNRRYALDAQANTEEDMEAGKTALEIDAQSARTRLQKVVEDLKVPESVKLQNQTQEKLNNDIAEWKASVSSVVPKFNKIELAFPDEKEKPFVFEIPAGDLPEIEKMAQSIIGSPDLANKIAFDKDGNFDMTRLLTGIYFSQPENLNKVMTAYSTAAAAIEINKLKDTFKNSTAPGTGLNDNEGGATRWETPDEAFARHRAG